MRDAIAEDDFNTFYNGLPFALTNRAEDIFYRIRGYYDINELFELEFDNMLNESLDRAQRKKIGMRTRRLRKRLAISRKKAMRRAPTRAKIIKRSRRSAIDTVKRKVSGGKSYRDMSVAQKRIVDRKVQRRQKVVDRLTRKIIPTKRRGK